jgi:acetyl esterase/lipase
MRPLRVVCALLSVLLPALSATGCAGPRKGPVVFFLDGAGWYSGSGPVEAGLRRAGYTGAFSRYSWSAFLGPAHDHFVNASSRSIARGLARKLEKVRRNDPHGQIHVVGLSAGTSVILLALEQMAKGMQVDCVVLLSPTVSAEHDLTKAMQHVRRCLYATSSPHDAIVGGLVVNADGRDGPPAGENGFRLPPGGGEKTRAAYARVVNLPWEPSYAGFNWSGGHTGVTSPEFIAAVIAPRLLTSEPFPLDRAVVHAPPVPAKEKPG